MNPSPGIDAPSPLPAPPPRRRPLWLRLLILAFQVGGSVVLILAGFVLAVVLLWQRPWFRESVMSVMITRGASQPTAPPPAPAGTYTGLVASATGLTDAAALLRPDRIWTSHLRFSGPDWKALGPNRIPGLPAWQNPDGTLNLNNPLATRPGIAGVFGFDLPWSRADFEFGGVLLTNAAARFKGNGTLLGELGSYRKPFKVDLDRFVDDQSLAGLSVFNLHNLTADRSLLSDTLAYEYFRDAGVPAPRTTFTRLHLTIEGSFERRLLGLYLVVENPDGDWAQRVFGRKGAALFKPVTPDLFLDLGDAWLPYHETYDPKTRTTPEQRARLVSLARLVTHADDAEFNARIGDWIDLEAAARFFAAETLLANYDGILCNGQNFLLWLDPNTQRFGFSPWDLDHAWGEFPFIADAPKREQGAIHHPWIDPNRFLTRLFAAESFHTRFRTELRRQVDTLFVPERLFRRLDELAALIRPAVAEESTNRLARFEAAVGAPRERGERNEPLDHERQPIHQLKRYIAGRSASVRDQLDGKSEGIVLTRNRW